MFHHTLDPIRHPVVSLRGRTGHGRTVLRAVLVLAVAGLLLLPLAPRAAGALTYTLDFYRLSVTDESGEIGSDEPYVLFFVGNLTTGEAVVKRTSIFGSMDSGESREETVRLWGPNDTEAAFPGDTPDNLVILVQAMEHDNCDVEEVRADMESWMRYQLGQYLKQGLGRDRIASELHTDMAIMAQCSARKPPYNEDDSVGYIQELRITAEDIAAADSGTPVDKELTHYDDFRDDTTYLTYYRLQAAGMPGETRQPEFVLADFGVEAGGWHVDRHPRLLGDVNGDGRADIVGFGQDTVFVALGQPSGGFGLAFPVLNDFAIDAGGWHVDRHPRLLGDVNGDGRADIVGFGQDTVFVALGQPSGGFGLAFPVLNDFTIDAGGWHVDRHPRLLGDVNGDGRADIVGFGQDTVFVALGQPSGGFGLAFPVLNDFTIDAGGWHVDRHPRLLGDVNGDGRADIVGFGQDTVFVALGQPSGGFGPAFPVLNDFTIDAGGWHVDQHPRLLGDDNGDGRADIVGFGQDTVFVALGQPSGGFGPAFPVLNDFTIDAGGWHVDQHPRLLGDVNGDGRDDIVGFGRDGVWVARALAPLP